MKPGSEMRSNGRNKRHGSTGQLGRCGPQEGDLTQGVSKERNSA